MNRKQTLGKPDQRDLNENLAATHGLAHMIQECRKLFRVSKKTKLVFAARAERHCHLWLAVARQTPCCVPSVCPANKHTSAGYITCLIQFTVMIT